MEDFRLTWDAQGEHQYETGVNHGVLYPLNSEGKYEEGKVWNGLTSVSESPEGAEVTAIYADNIKYLNLMSAEDFKGTIEAYTYPDEFAECDGSAQLVSGIPGITIGQQARKKFGLCYATKVGNDVNADAGEKIHIVYNCLASPSERSYETVNDSPEAITFSWEFSTTPVKVSAANLKDTATLVIDTTDLVAAKKGYIVDYIKAVLYGTTNQDIIGAVNTALYGVQETPSWNGTPMLLLPDDIAKVAAIPAPSLEL